MSTDSAWRQWGERDPYFAVITDPRYRADSLTDEAKAHFFHTGDYHAKYVIDLCRRRLDPNFAPRRALDFGCGVGRVLVPLAGLVERVVGVDISPAMLDEARRNCDEQGRANVELVVSDDALSALTQRFDLVHSCIVLQHIDIERGRLLFRRLVELVDDGGCGALQVTYGKARLPDTFGQPAAPAAPAAAPLQMQARAGWRDWMTRARRAVADAADQGDPDMQMNAYNLSELAFMLQTVGVRSMHVEFTDHGGELGVFLFFRKPAAAAGSPAP